MQLIQKETDRRASGEAEGKYFTAGKHKKTHKWFQHYE